MKKISIPRARINSFLLPLFIDGMMGLVQTSVPLLALRFGASAWFLGMLGWVPQSLRLPICLISGRVSERHGRPRVMVPAVIMMFICCIAFTLAPNKLYVLIIYSLLMMSGGQFYTALEAFIGDHSPKGELRKNLSSFNIGWSIGGAICAVMAGFLFVSRTFLPFGLGAVLVIVGMAILISWSREPIVGHHSNEDFSTVSTSDDPGSLLTIARISHVLLFLGAAMIRSILPKLGAELGMGEATIGVIMGIAIVGQFAGMLIAGMSSWWRGKLWPLILSQGALSIAGLAVYFSSSAYVFAFATFLYGLSLAVAYTIALYCGLQDRKNMGHNTGIHESLATIGLIAGSFIGGLSAQLISTRAPYFIISVVALLSMGFCVVYRRYAIASKKESPDAV